jgi:hypothetical protein
MPLGGGVPDDAVVNVKSPELPVLPLPSVELT